MPVMNHKVPVLSMLVSLEGNVEREINRDILVDAAPDREEFLKRTATTEEIRKTLKLGVNSPSPHWLYSAQKKREFNIKDISTRFSTFGPLVAVEKTDENRATKMRSIRRVRRRILSTSPVSNSSFSAGPLNLASTLGTTWPLSTQDKLISPRLLGPTHILVVYATQASKNSFSPSQKRDASNTFRDTRRRTIVAPTFSEVAEIPINDLLFLLNVPNLMPPTSGDRDSAADFTILPRRLQNEMPRVMLYVPHLETFPELVIYLHTKNQAALFRSIIPEWIRDLIHPLPTVAAANCNIASSNFVFDGLKVKKLLGKLAPESLHFSPWRTQSTVAVELAEMSSQLNVVDDPLLSTAALLTAMRNNLEYIGYYDRDLWSELNTYRSIMLQAISHRANVDVIAAN